MKKITEKINKKIQELIDKFNTVEGDEYERMYRIYGDIEDATYTDNHTLEIYFVSKGYGDEGCNNGTIAIMNEEEYNKAKPKSFYNRFRDETTWSYPTLEYSANSLARFVNKCGGKVKQIKYTEYKD